MDTINTRERAYARCDEWILPCFGLCRDRLYVSDGEGGTLRVRHGTGEAVRQFTEAEFSGFAFIEWIAAVHRYETLRDMADGQ